MIDLTDGSLHRQPLDGRTANGNIVLSRGTGHAVVEQPVELSGGTTLSLGKTTVAISRRDDPLPFGHAKTLVAISAEQPLDIIKTIAFFDAEGNPIQHCDVGGDCITSNGATTYRSYFGLAEEVDAVTVRIAHYSPTML